MGIDRSYGAPRCQKCGSSHFMSQPCLSVAEVRAQNVLESITPAQIRRMDEAAESDCSACQLKDRRIAELEAKLEKGRASRRVYQREYMRKRRATRAK